MEFWRAQFESLWCMQKRFLKFRHFEIENLLTGTNPDPLGQTSINPHHADVSESLIRQRGANMPHIGNWLCWRYFCILCTKNGIKGLWGDRGWPSLGPGPAMVVQWTLPWPYNTSTIDLCILAIFVHSMPQIWDHLTQGRQRLTPIGSRTHLGPSMDAAMALQYTKHGPSMDPAMAILGAL